MRPLPNHWVSARGPSDRCGACDEEIYNPGKRTNVQITGRCAEPTVARYPSTAWHCAACSGRPDGTESSAQPLHPGFCQKCRRFMGDRAFVVYTPTAWPEPPPLRIPGQGMSGTRTFMAKETAGLRLVEAIARGPTARHWLTVPAWSLACILLGVALTLLARGCH